MYAVLRLVRVDKQKGAQRQGRKRRAAIDEMPVLVHFGSPGVQGSPQREPRGGKHGKEDEGGGGAFLYLIPICGPPGTGCSPANVPRRGEEGTRGEKDGGEEEEAKISVWLTHLT